MAYDRETLEQVAEIFRQRRANAIAQQQARREEVYKKIPRIKEIDALTKERYRELVSGIFGGKSLTKSEIRSSSVDLRAERAELLATNGYPIDYLDVKFECRRCSDEGFVKGRMCACYQRELARVAMSRTKISMLMQDQSFKNFKLDYYSDVKNGNGKSPRVQMAQVLEFCKNYAKQFTPHANSLFLNGATGLGKTFLSSCIAREVIEHGYSVVYDSAQNIIHAFEQVKFDRAGEKADLDQYSNCDLLIIDDLGTEFITQYSMSVVYMLLNNRILAQRPTIVSSNLDGEVLKQYYSESIVSRLSGEFMTVPFVGSDIRVRKGGQRKRS